ncbi:hypothetical protein GF322_03480 [Candidatus Dependentiae bacterium]|nr:hypothetical protein [Candidatus Dependentiae bacterium]
MIKEIIKLFKSKKMVLLFLMMTPFFLLSIDLKKSGKAINQVNETEALNTPNVKIINNPTVEQNELFKQEKSNKKSKESNKKKVDKNNKGGIYLNFENASLSSVVNYMSEQKKINIIPRKELDGINVTLSTREALTLDSAWNILLTLLEMNNFSIINVDGLYRIVPKVEDKSQPLPFYSSATGTEPEQLPDSDLVVRYLYFLKNIKAENVQGILSTMIDGTVQINRDLDACIITAKCLDIKASMKIVKELDQGGLRESIKIIPLKYADVQDVVTLFNEIIPQGDQQRGNIRFMPSNVKKPSSYFSKDTRIIPDSRNNSLILLGTEKNLDKIIAFVYKYIDVPITATESRLHIKEIKYAKAENLQPLLTNLVNPPAGVGKAIKVGEYKFFEDVIIAADSSQGDQQGGGNRLIIACNQDDWKRIEGFIDKLDKPQPQVAFEVMVVDVSIKTDDELWSQVKPKHPNYFGAGINMQFRTMQDSSDIKVVTTNADRNIIRTNMSFGPSSNLWGLVRAILKKDNFNIITQPFLVANNYQECFVEAKETRQADAGLQDNRTGTEAVVKKEYKDASTLVKLTPKVNLNGTVDLKINVDITSFQEVTGTSPNTDDRVLSTRVNIGTGEVLVLGGLTRSKLTENQYKVPILGDIPLIGNLFRSKTKNKERSNLYIFIRPSIIKPRFEGVPDEYTQLKLDYAKFQSLNVDTYAKEKDPIQRWFFKPSKQSAREKIEDARKGIFRPIDNYTYGAKQPKSVEITKDPYFRVSEAVEEEKQKLEKGKTKTKRSLKSRKQS